MRRPFIEQPEPNPVRNIEPKWVSTLDATSKLSASHWCHSTALWRFLHASGSDVIPTDRIGPLFGPITSTMASIMLPLSMNLVHPSAPDMCTRSRPHIPWGGYSARHKYPESRPGRPPPEPAGRGQSLDPGRFGHPLVTSKGRKKPAAPKGGRFAEGSPAEAARNAPKAERGDRRRARAGIARPPVRKMRRGEPAHCMRPGPAARHDTPRPPRRAASGPQVRKAQHHAADGLPRVRGRLAAKRSGRICPAIAQGRRRSQPEVPDAHQERRIPPDAADWGAMPPGPARQNGQAPR